ncbi:hypothetical protein CsSME_00028493 [Camellia sinensis var. sinensis]
MASKSYDRIADICDDLISLLIKPYTFSSSSTNVCKKFFRLLLILLQTHLQSSMGRQGCTFPTYARKPNVRGLPETVRDCRRR